MLNNSCFPSLSSFSSVALPSLYQPGSRLISELTLPFPCLQPAGTTQRCLATTRRAALDPSKKQPLCEKANSKGKGKKKIPLKIQAQQTCGCYQPRPVVWEERGWGTGLGGGDGSSSPPPRSRSGAASPAHSCAMSQASEKPGGFKNNTPRSRDALLAFWFPSLPHAHSPCF